MLTKIRENSTISTVLFFIASSLVIHVNSFFLHIMHSVSADSIRGFSFVLNLCCSVFLPFGLIFWEVKEDLATKVIAWKPNFLVIMVNGVFVCASFFIEALYLPSLVTSVMTLGFIVYKVFK